MFCNELGSGKRNPKNWHHRSPPQPLAGGRKAPPASGPHRRSLPEPARSQGRGATGRGRAAAASGGERGGGRTTGVRPWCRGSPTRVDCARVLAHGRPEPPARLALDAAWRSLACRGYLFLMLGVDRDNKPSEQSKDALRGEF